MKALLGSLAVVILFLSTQPAGWIASSPDTGDGIVVARYNQLRDGRATDVGAFSTPVVLWSFATNGTIATSPLAADVDGDGDLDVFFGEYMPMDAAGGSRHGYVVDARGRLEYTVPMRFNTVAEAAADLDGDGLPELIFSEGSHTDVAGGIGYRVFHGRDGSPAWSFETPFIGGEGFFASPAVIDVDGDGGLDLIAGGVDHAVYALRGVDGSTIWAVHGLEHYVRHATPLADLDADGRMEVTVHTEAGVVHTLDAVSGDEKWSLDLGDIVAATPAIGDLDGDGKPEVVYSLVVDGGVVALHGDGSLLWRQRVHDFSYRGPTLVDVDGDGLVDVVDGDSDDPSITAYRGTDGSVLWDVPLPASWASGPLVTADTDGDRRMEILAGSDAGLIALDAASGATKFQVPLPSIRGEPLVRDIDGDGSAEILVGAGDGRLYALGAPPHPRFEPRTIGYWKHQCTISSPSGDHVGIPQSFVDAIRSRSKVFAGIEMREQVCEILQGPRGNDMRARAEQQLMALWLNIVSGFVGESARINLPMTTANTVGGAVAEVEAILAGTASRADLERAKDICDAINNGFR